MCRITSTKARELCWDLFILNFFPKEPQPTQIYKIIFTAKTQLIRVKINRHNYDKMCHVQSKPVKKLIKAKLFINLGQMSLAKLRPSWFSLPRQIKQAWEAISSGYSCNLLVCHFVAFLPTFVPFLGYLRIGKYLDVGIRFKSSRLIFFIFKSLLEKYNFQQ